jgi:hypothetical protein
VRPVRAVALAASLVVLAAGCVGSGKVARPSDLDPLPPGVRVAAEQSTGCRDGESGFDYRFVVLAGSSDLSTEGPLLTRLRDNGFYHSVGLPDDLPWITVAYQQRAFPLRAEIGMLSRYLEQPVPHHGPEPASLPAEVRDDPGAVLVALRPTDFLCETPL